MTKEMDFHPEGLVNLAIALIDDARKKYVKAIAGSAKAAKMPVQEWYDSHKDLVHSWEVSRFVIKDDYGLFSEFDSEGVFRTWNSLAQRYLDEKKKPS